MRRTRVLVFALSCAALVVAGGAGARTDRQMITAVIVNTTADELAPGDNKTSLREAFAQANATSGEIDIVLGSRQQYNLTLCGAPDDDANKVGDLDHFGGGILTVSGNGSTIRQTCPNSRVFDQQTSALLNLTDMTVSGGHAASQPGGGVFARGGGELQIKNDVFTGNLSDAAGGAIASFGPTVITGSDISLNQSTELAGGVASIGPLILVRSIVSGNTAPLIGGVAASAGLKTAYSTIQDNSIPNVDVQEGGLVSFGSVVGVPRPSTGAPPPGFGPPPTTSCRIAGGTTSLGYNWDNDGSCGFGGGTGDRSNAGDPKLRPQSVTGYTIPLVVPASGSKLVDAIPKSACNPAPPWTPSWSPLTADLRGLARPQGTGCDIGAIEVGNANAKPPRARCMAIAASRRAIRVGATTTLVVRIAGNAKVRVTIVNGRTRWTARTNASGRAVFRIGARVRGSLRVTAPGACPIKIPVR